MTLDTVDALDTVKTDAFRFDSKKLENSVVSFGLGAATTAGGIYVLFSEQPAQAEVPKEVAAVVANATDTIPVLTGICLAVFSAGLAPWAARTTLSWLSSIMKGAI
jgi:hypothetical protein